MEGKLLETSRRRGATLNETGWRENEVQHSVKIDSRLQSRGYTWQIVNTKKETEEKKKKLLPNLSPPTLHKPQATAHYSEKHGHVRPLDQMSAVYCMNLPDLKPRYKHRSRKKIKYEDREENNI